MPGTWENRALDLEGLLMESSMVKEGTMLFNSLKVAAALLQHYECMLQDGDIKLSGCGFEFPDGSKVDWMPENFVAYARDGVDCVIAWMESSD